MRTHMFCLAGVIALTLLAGGGAWSHRAHAEDAVPAVRLPGFEELAEKLLPTVVNVSTTMKIESPVRGELPPMPDLPACLRW